MHVLNAHLTEMFSLEVGSAQCFHPESMTGFKFYHAKMLFFNIFVIVHLGKGHNQTINMAFWPRRGSAADSLFSGVNFSYAHVMSVLGGAYSCVGVSVWCVSVLGDLWL